MSRLHNVARMLLLIAAILALAASVFIFFFAGGTQVTETAGGAETERQLAWFESQGWWGIAILFIYSALYYGPLRFFDHARVGMVYLFGLVAIAFTILAMFSIGPFYLPSALFVLFALILIALDPLNHQKT